MRTTLLASYVTLVLVALVAAACGGKAKSGWTAIDTKAMSEGQLAQQAEGVAAQKKLFGGLIGRLSAALGDGPDKAIHVCKVAAPEITDGVAKDADLKIGRTSHRLRNPKNVEPEWAKPYIARRTREPVWLQHEDGRLAGLLPIPTMSLCLTCHGPWKDIQPPVRKALEEHYPEDRGHGFNVGDIRGWFWLEIPAR